MKTFLSLLFVITSQRSVSPDLCNFIQMEREGIYFNAGDEYVSAFLSYPSINKARDTETLPQSSMRKKFPALTINQASYRRAFISLSLEPYLYDHLMPYLSQYWEGWGMRVPYVGNWTFSAEEYVDGEWLPVEFRGEITPSCVSSVSEELLSDADYNGVPSAFWNYKVSE
jgi:hypothetical protein